MGGGRFGSTAGSTLTQGIAIPNTLDGFFLGTDEEGNFTADCYFDELRVQNAVHVGFTPGTELKPTSSTLVLDHFEDDLPSPDPQNLNALINELEQRQRSRAMQEFGPEIRELQNFKYLLAKHEVGLSEKYLG